MRLHVVSLPHTQTTPRYLTCAYTQKVVRFGKMMRPLGYEVILYGGEENEAECDEFVPLVSEDEARRWFGSDADPDHFDITWNPNDKPWRTMNARAVDAIRERRSAQDDLVLLIAGTAQQPIAEGLSDMISCEWGIGYEGFFSDYCAFESAAWMHYLYGKRGMGDGRWYDAVIPNFHDPDDFHLADKGDFLLFVGRVVLRKGPHVAAAIAERLGKRLIIAGPGVTSVEPGRIIAPEVTIEGDHVDYLGVLNSEQRAGIMAQAQALIAPTLYIEPFGGVTVEAMLSGTPVVTSDWGAFTETVAPEAGRRFRTLGEGARAVEEATELDATSIRDYALGRYSLSAVAPRFDAWFQRLGGLWGDGWYG